MPERDFPKDFLWGASTAAHQIEGAMHNQWSEWELASAAQLAKTAEHRLGWLPNWQAVKTAAEQPVNYVSDTGVDHYGRYKEDFDLLITLNLNAFRFGIEWSRLEPEPGKWNEAEIEHYSRYIQELKKRGIEPILNLWHWTMPVWFVERGGFAKATNLAVFERFVRKVIETYGQDLKYVITLNEPNVYTVFSYVSGEWPPLAKNPLLGLKVYLNLVKAQRRTYRSIKAINTKLQVGIAQNMSNDQPLRSSNVFDRWIARFMSYAWNFWFVNRIRKCQDFIGINYYFTNYWHGFKQKNPPEPVNDLGWYMEPRGLQAVLEATWRRYKKPLLVTENGLADAADAHRQWWLEETLAALHGALKDGVGLIGYLHWSLLDNFEWAYGWWPKFGLVAVDREHGMKRTIRPSARWLAKRLAETRHI